MSDSTSVPDIPASVLFQPEDADKLEATIEIAAGAQDPSDFLVLMEACNLPRDERALNLVRSEMRRRKSLGITRMSVGRRG